MIMALAQICDACNLQSANLRQIFITIIRHHEFGPDDQQEQAQAQTQAQSLGDQLIKARATLLHLNDVGYTKEECRVLIQAPPVQLHRRHRTLVLDHLLITALSLAQKV
jgi:hypothetical protein